MSNIYIVSNPAILNEARDYLDGLIAEDLVALVNAIRIVKLFEYVVTHIVFGF